MYDALEQFNIYSIITCSYCAFGIILYLFSNIFLNIQLDKGTLSVIIVTLSVICLSNLNLISIFSLILLGLFVTPIAIL